MARVETVDLVWNKGIAALCDWRIPNEFTDTGDYRHIPTVHGPRRLIADCEQYSGIADCELVWVRLTWIKSFIEQVLPIVNAKFVLVTGDSDHSVPSALQYEAALILRSPNVLCWYTQNYDGSDLSGRMSGMPIGIDFHTLSERPFWDEAQSSPVAQEEELKSIRDTLPPTGDRIPMVYIDFACQAKPTGPLVGTELGQERRLIVDRLRTNPLVFCQSCPLPRSQMWRKRGEYAFVVSPHGDGLDCHRTWEALALGHIVIAPSCSLNPLYAGLPVPQVRNWNEITPEKLKLWLSMYSDNTWVQGQLMSRYWEQRIRAVAEFQFSYRNKWKRNCMRA
jgi:hypothetical protein